MVLKKYLCNFGPAVASISHLFQPQLFLWSPRRVRSALLGWGLCDWGIIRILGRDWWLGRSSALSSRRRGRGRLALTRSNWRLGVSWSRRRDAVRGRSLALTAWLSRSLSRGLLLRRRPIRGLLRYVHRRLNRRCVLLLLLLLRVGSHVWLRSAIGKLHPLVAACHVSLLVRMVAA